MKTGTLKEIRGRKEYIKKFKIENSETKVLFC